MTSIDDIRRALAAKLEDEGKVRLLSARLILRTGVNLMEPRPEHVHDPACVRKVIDGLAAMGFELDLLGRGRW